MNMRPTNCLLADSGSTKTTWCLVSDGSPSLTFRTGGINPFYQTEAGIERELIGNVLPALPSGGADTVCFYGAGCIGEKAAALRRLLARLFPSAQTVDVETDMLGAARALCGHSAGIACILGTGSNSCFYDGTRICANVPPLGFILGDEGSGAVLGKLLVGNVLKRLWPSRLADAFFAYTGLTQEALLDRVYRQPFPNRFLAGLAPFLSARLDEEPVRRLVAGSFRDFLTRNVAQYDYRTHPVHFTGSVAWHFRALLEEAAHDLGIGLGHVVQSPIEGLVRFHSGR